MDDVRYALRQMRLAPGFTTAAELTLAIAIGATTAMFSVVEAVLLRPLPYPGAERLVRIVEHSTEQSNEIGYQQSLAGILTTDLPAFRSSATTLSHAGVYSTETFTVSGRGEPLRLDGTRLSPAVMEMLGVAAAVGRRFGADEEQPTAGDVVILSHTLWQRHFAGAQDVVGHRLSLNDRPFTIVGVMPPGFQFPDSQTLFWIPYTLGARAARLPPIARLSNGATVEEASANVDAVVRQLRAAEPRRPGARQSTATTRFELETIHEHLVAPVRTALVVVTAAVGFVLLIGCVNLTNLILARNVARQQEIAVRVALGVGPFRLVRQLFVEILLLVACGGAASVAFAAGALQALRSFGVSLPRRDLTPGVSIPRLDEVAINGPALAFTAIVCGFVAVVVGLLPVLRFARSRGLDALTSRGSASGSSSRTQHPVQRALVVAEIALATVSLIGAGLLVNSFVHLSRVDSGYDAANLVTFGVRAPAAQTSSSFHRDVADRLRSLPGVVAVGYAELLPMVRFRVGVPLRPAQPMPPGTPPPPAPIDQRIVSDDFMRAMSMRVVEGRGFRADDGPVVLINRTLARSGFLGPKPIGMHVYPTARPLPFEVIGIVEDVRQYGLDQEPDPQVFIEVRQLPSGNPNPYFAVRVEQNPLGHIAAMREAVREVDPSAVLDGVATMQQIVTNSISRPRLFAALGAVFAAIGALLGAIGIYGVISYSVAQRTRELGVRLAIGARPPQLLGLVVGQGLRWTSVGLAIGVGAALALTRSMTGLLFGVTALDARTFVAVSAMFFAVAMLATFVAARRTTSVDPLVALRAE